MVHVFCVRASHLCFRPRYCGGFGWAPMDISQLWIKMDLINFYSDHVIDSFFGIEKRGKSETPSVHVCDAQLLTAVPCLALTNTNPLCFITHN